MVFWRILRFMMSLGGSLGLCGLLEDPEVYEVFWEILRFMWSFGGSLGFDPLFRSSRNEPEHQFLNLD